jgi:hypothetical protein
MPAMHNVAGWPDQAVRGGRGCEMMMAVISIRLA